MRVLVTRPIEDAIETASQLASRSHQSVIAPLLEIRFFEGAPLALDGVQAILATSSNGVRAFSQRSARRDLPLFAVGAQTASVARAQGFCNVKSADGDARALCKAIPGWADPEGGALMHLAGSGRPGKLVSDLAARGYRVQTCALYHTVPVQRLPDTAREALLAGVLDAVLFFSPQTAQTFVDRIIDEGLRSCCVALIACCISEAATTSLQSLRFRDIRTSSHPDLTRLLLLLD